MRFSKWLYPGIGIKRWVFLSFLGLNITIIGIFIGIGYNYLDRFKDTIGSTDLLGESKQLLIILGLFIAIIGLILIIYGIKRVFESVLQYFIPKNEEKLSEIIYEKQYLKKGPKIVAIGGGTGLSVLLRGLKEYTSNITAIVTVSDDGGSSGRLRGELGILPPGDIRNCLLALADTEPLLESLFQYRFEAGHLKGHSFGNLLIAAMTGLLGDFQKGIKEFSKVLAVKGTVLPVTLEYTVLYAETTDKEIIEGQSNITNSNSPIKRVFIKPELCKPTNEAIEAINEADAVVLGPGSLFTSIIPNLLIDGIGESISNTKAKKIYVVNVMTQKGETNEFSAYDHLQEIIEYGGSSIVDSVIINTENIPDEVLNRYKKEGSIPVEPDINKIKELNKEVIHGNFINKTNLVRHDSNLLAKKIINIAEDKKNKMKTRNGMW